MNNLKTLIETLDRRQYEVLDGPNQGEEKNAYLVYKLAAVKCEKQLEERRKIRHARLLNRVAEIDDELKAKKLKEPSFTRPQVQDADLLASPTRSMKMPAFMDHNFNRVGDDDDITESKEASALVETFSKLEDLKNQEKMLEGWYGSMSDQLEQEQRKLTERFNEMRVKILQQKQYYLKTSQEYINNISSSSEMNGRHIEHETSATRVMEDTHLEPQHQLEAEVKQNKMANQHFSDAKWKQASPKRSLFFDDIINKEPSRQKTASAVQNRKGRRYVAFRETEPGEHGQSQAGEKAIEVSENEMLVKEHSGSPVAYDLSGLIEKTLTISPIQDKPLTEKAKSASRSSLQMKHRFYAEVQDKSNNFSANISSSTPISKGSSFETREGEYKGINRGRISGFENTNEIQLSKRSCDFLFAAAQGHLTRKLMNTDKVQELIKTIKDTRVVLRDLEKEATVSKKLHESKADFALKTTLLHELQNAQSKLHSIFMAYSPAAKVEMMKRSRAAAVDRENKHLFKDRSSSLNQPKRLSTATRRTLRRRQETSLHDKSIPRPHTSPATKNVQTGRKERKSWDIRSLRPTPSSSSPFQISRTREQKQVTVLKEVEIVNIPEPSMQRKKQTGPPKKVSRKKMVLATTLNRRANSPNG
ncbi:uncharacterized protein LOC135691918 [Rhopilema esculentum]|uniref:uncharacterized protein LOC135691918 n=1 Tax=Rhopilema esculentum TaxID=499914 RepID=UPI0031DB96E7